MAEHDDSGRQEAPLVACPECRSEGGHWIDGRFAPCEACGRTGRPLRARARVADGRHSGPALGFTDRGRRSFGVASQRRVAVEHDGGMVRAGLGLEEDGVNEPLKSLAKEFGEFLREDTMPTLDDAATARQYLAESQRKLTQTVHDMQAGFGFPKHWHPGKGLAMEAVGIWKYQYPEEDHYANYVYCGLAFKPEDEKDGALRAFARYENESVGDPSRVDIGDGFYAFACIYAMATECRRVPGFAVNRWYERQDGKLVAVDDGRAVDSTGWWHFSDGGTGRARYARIRPLQDLLDDDGRLGRRLTKLGPTRLWGRPWRSGTLSLETGNRRRTRSVASKHKRWPAGRRAPRTVWQLCGSRRFRTLPEWPVAQFERIPKTGSTEDSPVCHTVLGALCHGAPPRCPSNRATHVLQHRADYLLLTGRNPVD